MNINTGIVCVECGSIFVDYQRDILLCNKCLDLFDLEKLWQDHDANKIDALDFNDYKEFRELYRIKKRG